MGGTDELMAFVTYISFARVGNVYIAVVWLSVRTQSWGQKGGIEHRGRTSEEGERVVVS